MTVFFNLLGFLKAFSGPRIENRILRIRETGSLHVHTGYLTISFKKTDLLSRYHAGIMASISLFMVVSYNFCIRDFVIDHKLSIGFSGQSNTFNFCFLKFIFSFSGERHEERSCWNFPPPPGNAFSYLEWLFFQLRQCICLNSSYLELA